VPSQAVLVLIVNRIDPLIER